MSESISTPPARPANLRVVGGTITDIVEGDYTINSESTIVNNAATSVIQVGDENGVSYGEYVEPAINQDDTEYIYYTEEGLFLGGDESSDKVYLTTQSEYDIAKEDEKWSVVNSDELKLFDESISHNDFLIYGGIISGEATNSEATRVGISETELQEERYAFGNMVHNFMSSTNKKTISDIPRNYSYALKEKTSAFKKVAESKPDDRSDKWIQCALFGVINALQDGRDYSNGASFWDGGDVFTGNASHNYDPMQHYRQRPHHNDSRLVGIFDENNIAIKTYENLKKYYTEFDTHREEHLEHSLYTHPTRLYYGNVAMLSESDENQILTDTEGVVNNDFNEPNTILNSIGTGVFQVGYMCLWIVKAQSACSIFYSEGKYELE